ncbi:MAG: hypothetical protein U1F36_01755 [Planctomycetota bacterium]
MRQAFLLALVPVLSASLGAQNLLRDINSTVDPSPSSTVYQRAASTGSSLFFSANDQISGEEPWVTDGTAAGTRRVADCAAGGSPSSPVDFTPFLGGCAFRTAIPAVLWWSDGSAAGTQVLCNFPGAAVPCVFQGRLWFSAFSAANGEELWTSNGTAAGTALFADLVPGTVSSLPRHLTSGAGALWFVTNDGNLWRSDGTVTNTNPVVPVGGFGQVVDFAVGPAGALVCAFNGAIGEVWFTDGTAAGSVRLVTGLHGYASGPVALGNRFLFHADDNLHGREPWVTDGTPAGTAMLADIDPDPNALPGPGIPFVVGGLAFFRAHDPVHGSELWVTDGTGAGTHLVADLWIGTGDSWPSGFVALGNRVVFDATDPLHGYELWISDGTAAGTALIDDVYPSFQGSQAAPLGVVAGKVVFSAVDGVHGYEPWITDGTTAGTSLLRDIARIAVDSVSSSNLSFAGLGTRFVFPADDGVHGVEPWISDGTTAGTHLLADIAPGTDPSLPGGFFEWKGRLWFSANDPGEGAELWVSDGTTAGTSRFATFDPGVNGSYPNNFAEVGDRLCFFASTPTGSELWSTDGTAIGLVHLDLDPSDSVPSSVLVPLGGVLWFTGRDTQHGTSLWRTDGTLAGTTMVFDIVPGAGSGAISGLTASQGLLWFAGTDVDSYLPVDIEPWVSDGTAAGTHRLLDIAPGAGSSSPRGFVPFAGRTWFTVASTFGRDLWVSDGTAVGTTLFRTGPQIGDQLVVAGDRMFFVEGGELWSTDGTTAGTARVIDLYPGPTGADVAGLVALGDSRMVAFTGQDRAFDHEVWISDGTAAGTHRLVDVWPGTSPNVPFALAAVGPNLLMGAKSPGEGAEPWITTFAELGATLARRFGQSCASPSGAPTIGRIDRPSVGSSGFAITLDHARPLAPAAFFFGTTLFPDGDRLGCVPRVMPPAIAVGWVTDATGHAVQPLAVPADPALTGLHAYTHWLVLDPFGGFLGATTLSDMLEIVVGR